MTTAALQPDVALSLRAVALELYAVLRSVDPARFRDDLALAARQRLAVVEQRLAELLARLEQERAAHRVATRAAELRAAITAVDGGEGSLSEEWRERRARLVPSYEALAQALRAEAIHVPSLRPTNYRRTTFHMLSAVGTMLLLEVLLTPRQTIIASGCFAIPFWGLEIGRRFSPALNRALMRFFAPIAHPLEAHRVNSSTWYATALFILSWFQVTAPAAVAVVVLGFSDPAAALIGRRFGRRELVNGRTLEGTLAFFAVGTAVAFVTLRVFHAGIGALPALGVAAGAALVAAVVELLSRRVDDNFSVPLAAAAGAWASAAALGVGF